MKRWFLKHLPLAFILVIVWAIVRTRFSVENFFELNRAWLILPFICICFAVLVVEFFKSGEISFRSFEWDQAFAILELVVCTVVMTIVVREKMGLHFSDVVMSILVIADAFVSPSNSIRTARRDWAAKIGT